jgi:adenine deaminase
MLVPSEFARVAVRHGTVGTVSDPHEIGNVLGVDGVLYMIENGKKVPFSFHFGAPSCVPATKFETAGAEIGVADVKRLLEMPEVIYLSEMMNYPGVIHGDAEVMAKIRVAHELGKVVDGHAPGVRGKDLDAYLAAGITTDHECFTYEEGKEKLEKGMKVLIREGSAARNFAALIPLLREYPGQIMFCTDDMPDGLEEGHINKLVARAINEGYDPMAAIRAATLNPVEHYGLKTGLLQVGDPASFIVVKDLKSFDVHQTYIKGHKVAENGVCLFEGPQVECVNRFDRQPIGLEDLQVRAEAGSIHVIEAIDGELITKKGIYAPKIDKGFAISDPSRDILKLVVVNRYRKAPVAVAFIKNFGLKRGALAASVAHDSHNVIAVGASDEELLLAVNSLIEAKGGLALVDGKRLDLLKLPVAGLMSDRPSHEVSKLNRELQNKAKDLGCKLQAPFVTLSFMALLVIPDLKLSDLGLFDGKRFDFTTLTSEFQD